MVFGLMMLSFFFGLIYRFGWLGGMGGGMLEGVFYGIVYIFIGNLYFWNFYDDMGNLNVVVLDLLFYVYYVNIDWLWEVWKGMGGRYKDISDFDYLKL